MKLEENFTFINIRENMKTIESPCADFAVIRKLINPQAKSKMDLLQKGECII